MIEDLLVHTVELRRSVPGGTLDPEGEDRGHLATTDTLVGTYLGLVQPRTARERANATRDDASIGTHRIYLEASAIGVVTSDDYLRKTGTFADDLNGDYRIVGEVANAAGMGHHLEVAAERVIP
jgi:hypothetical protein